MILLAAVILITLDGPEGQTIYVNPANIVSVRPPQTDLIHPGIKCTLQTNDGKLINVVDTCEEVLLRIGKAEE